MTRDEHLAWCKSRALELLDAGKTVQAVVSMVNNLNKHAETSDWQAPQTPLRDADGVRSWIEAFR